MCDASHITPSIKKAIKTIECIHVMSVVHSEMKVSVQSIFYSLLYSFIRIYKNTMYQHCNFIFVYTIEVQPLEPWQRIIMRIVNIQRLCSGSAYTRRHICWSECECCCVSQHNTLNSTWPRIRHALATGLCNLVCWLVRLSMIVTS